MVVFINKLMNQEPLTASEMSMFVWSCEHVSSFLPSFLQPLSPLNEECPVAAREGNKEEEEEKEGRQLAPSKAQPPQDETTPGAALTQSDELQHSVESTTTARPRASDALPIRLPAAKYTPPQTRWAPKTPQEPMEKLVHMGFANRTLNAQLLAKHNDHLRAVINDLLDNQG